MLFWGKPLSFPSLVPGLPPASLLLPSVFRKWAAASCKVPGVAEAVARRPSGQALERLFWSQRGLFVCTPTCRSACLLCRKRLPVTLQQGGGGVGDCFSRAPGRLFPSRGEGWCGQGSYFSNFQGGGGRVSLRRLSPALCPREQDWGEQQRPEKSEPPPPPMQGPKIALFPDGLPNIASRALCLGGACLYGDGAVHRMRDCACWGNRLRAPGLETGAGRLLGAALLGGHMASGGGGGASIPGMLSRAFPSPGWREGTEEGQSARGHQCA